jgi:uroporphyrinogen-III decarboxylase
VPNCIIFLVATKIDLMGPGEVDKLRDRRAELLEAAGGRELYFTSSVTEQGVKEIFRDAAACWEQICAPETPALVQVNRGAKDAPKKERCGC